MEGYQWNKLCSQNLMDINKIAKINKIVRFSYFSQFIIFCPRPLVFLSKACFIDTPPLWLALESRNLRIWRFGKVEKEISEHLLKSVTKETRVHQRCWNVSPKKPRGKPKKPKKPKLFERWEWTCHVCKWKSSTSHLSKFFGFFGFFGFPRGFFGDKFHHLWWTLVSLVTDFSKFSEILFTC